MKLANPVFTFELRTMSREASPHIVQSGNLIARMLARCVAVDHEHVGSLHITHFFRLNLLFYIVTMLSDWSG